MLVLEECRGWEYSARGLEAKQRYFASSPPDSSADFGGSGFRVWENMLLFLLFLLFILECFMGLPSTTALCSHKLMWFLFISVCLVTLQCCWVLLD